MTTQGHPEPQSMLNLWDLEFSFLDLLFSLIETALSPSDIKVHNCLSPAYILPVIVGKYTLLSLCLSAFCSGMLNSVLVDAHSPLLPSPPPPPLSAVEDSICLFHSQIPVFAAAVQWVFTFRPAVQSIWGSWSCY